MIAALFGESILIREINSNLMAWQESNFVASADEKRFKVIAQVHNSAEE